MSRAPDLAQIRFDNAIGLFEEFVHNTIKHPDAATLRGLEGRFAEKVQIQPSYWSQIKGRSRQIGERLARQFEQLCRKPNGWMDQPHGEFANATSASASGAVSAPGQLTQVVALPNDNATPQDADERFIVGLVLTYYRRHPQRARTQLLDILGEVLGGGLTPIENRATSALVTVKPAALTAVKSNPPTLKTDASTADIHALWLRSQAGVAPLRRKK